MASDSLISVIGGLIRRENRLAREEKAKLKASEAEAVEDEEEEEDEEPVGKPSDNQPPADEPPPEADFDDVVVRIRWRDNQPAWFINDISVRSLAQLQEKLQVIQAIKRDAPVILHPDKQVPLGHVIDAYDRSRSAGFERIQFAASRAI